MFFISIISLLTTLSTVATNPVLRNEIWDDSNTLSSFDDVIDDSLVLANYDVQTDRDILSANEASSYSPSYKGNKYTTSDELLLSSNSCLSGPKAGSKPGGMCIKKPQCTNYDDDTRGLLNQKRSLVCCEGGYVTYAQARAKCIHFDPKEELCKDPANFACCMYCVGSPGCPVVSGFKCFPPEHNYDRDG